MITCLYDGCMYIGMRDCDIIMCMFKYKHTANKTLDKDDQRTKYNSA